MLHFPSTLQAGGSNPSPRRTDGLNATQQKRASHQIFSTIEEELHDARRVHAHGQEEDLRQALNMVINRVSELSSLLSEAYKSKADLEVQLNVAKSNLKLVISNNEMLEEALKRDPSVHARDVGWRRSSARESDSTRTSEERSSSVPPAPSSAFVDATPTLDSNANSPVVPPTPVSTNTEERRFFKFRFTSSPNPNPGTRPATPNGTVGGAGSGIYHHLNSPSLPSLPPLAHAKEVEELNEQLRKERAAKKKVEDEKAALEAELESLSQALFEEANKMVATERIKRAETEDELKEAFLEKEALRSALRLLEDQHSSETSSPMPLFSSPSPAFIPMSAPASHSRTSSDVAIKSAPVSPSPALARSPPPLASSSTSSPPSPSSSRSLSQSSSRHQSPPPTIVDTTPQRQRPPPLPLDEGEDSHDDGDEREYEDEPTPQFRRSRPPSLFLHERNPMYEASPWADAPSQSQCHPAKPVFAGAAV